MKLIRAQWTVEEEPRPVSDLTYSELVAIIGEITNYGREEEIKVFYMSLIDASLPGADVSDLIFWPNEWFKDESMLHIELTSEEIANYVLAWV